MPSLPTNNGDRTTCAGGCGLRVVPVQADDCGQQGGPWYCAACFEREALRRDAAHGKRLALALRQACWDANGPILPTPIAEALRAVVAWAEVDAREIMKGDNEMGRRRANVPAPAQEGWS